MCFGGKASSLGSTIATVLNMANYSSKNNSQSEQITANNSKVSIYNNFSGKSKYMVDSKTVGVLKEKSSSWNP